MAKLARAEVFDPSVVAVLHICTRVVRRCFFCVDPFTGKNHDHRRSGKGAKGNAANAAHCFGLVENDGFLGRLFGRSVCFSCSRAADCVTHESEP